jgi:hypothetical protein
MLEKNVGNDLLKCHSNEGCGFSTLPDDGVSANESKRGVPATHSHGKVEGSDDAHVTNGVPVLHHEVTGTLTGENLALNGTRKTDGHVADVDVFLDLAEALAADLAHLEGDKSAKGILLLAESNTDLADDLASDRGGGLGPADTLLLHGDNALVVLLDGGCLDDGDGLVGMGVH